MENSERRNEREKARERKDDCFKCHRSGTGNKDHMKRRNEREKHASAKAIASDATGRAPEIKIT